MTVDLAKIFLDKPDAFFEADSKSFLYPKIPMQKLLNAINSYCPEVNPKDVIMLIDDTFFGGAKEGIVLTSKNIYGKSLGGATLKVSVNDISEIKSIKKGIYINGRKFIQFNMPESQTIDVFCQKISSGIQDNVMNNDSLKVKRSSFNDELHEAFNGIHLKSIRDLRDELKTLDENCFYIDWLFEKQMNVFLHYFRGFEPDVQNIRGEVISQDETNRYNIELGILTFIQIHYYSMTSLPKDFREEISQLRFGAVGVYVDSFMRYFNEYFDENFGVYEPELFTSLSLLFADKDGEGSLTPKLPRKTLLIQNMGKLSIPQSIAQIIIDNFEGLVDQWAEKMAISLLQEE